MSNPELIELRIHHEVENETSGIRLSNKLFSPPDGLFCRLGETEEQRQAVIQSPLFREALERLAVLRGEEAAVLARAAEEFQRLLPKGDYLLILQEARMVSSRQFTDVAV